MNQAKTTLVLGASENPARYSNLAIKKLRQYSHPVKAIGLKPGLVQDVEIDTGTPAYEGIDTVTVYMNALRQQPYHDYLISLRPRRIIFNPGAENDELAALAQKNGIQPVEACTLVMLSTAQY